MPRRRIHPQDYKLQEWRLGGWGLHMTDDGALADSMLDADQLPGKGQSQPL